MHICAVKVKYLIADHLFFWGGEFSHPKHFLHRVALHGQLKGNGEGCTCHQCNPKHIQKIANVTTEGDYNGGYSFQRKDGRPGQVMVATRDPQGICV
jgi:hypothetical protein